MIYNGFVDKKRKKVGGTLCKAGIEIDELILECEKSKTQFEIPQDTIENLKDIKKRLKDIRKELYQSL